MTTTYTFTSAADAAIASEKKAGNLWLNLAGWVATEIAPMVQGKEDARELVKGAIDNAQEGYAEAHPKAKKLSEIVAYRSAKSVVLKAIECKITLVNDNGKVKAKSEVEAEIKEGKEEKTPIEKFRIVSTSLASIADNLLTESELLEAIMVLNDMKNKLSEFAATISK